MQNSKAMILDSENLVESPQGVESGENRNRAIPELDKTWFPCSEKYAKFNGHDHVNEAP